MKFLHEVIDINSKTGEKIYNGWWEIKGNYLYNYAGVRHSYIPSVDDEIIESSWEEVIKQEARNSTETTGWIAPNGEFFGCGYGDHSFLAEALFDSSCTEMQADGYCMIYWNRYVNNAFELPLGDLMIPDETLANIAASSQKGSYDYYCDTPLTAAQKEVLQKKGVKIKEKDKEEDV